MTFVWLLFSLHFNWYNWQKTKSISWIRSNQKRQFEKCLIWINNNCKCTKNRTSFNLSIPKQWLIEVCSMFNCSRQDAANRKILLPFFEGWDNNRLMFHMPPDQFHRKWLFVCMLNCCLCNKTTAFGPRAPFFNAVSLCMWSVGFCRFSLSLFPYSLMQL